MYQKSKISNIIESKSESFIKIDNVFIKYYLSTSIEDDNVYISIDSVKDLLSKDSIIKNIYTIQYKDTLINTCLIGEIVEHLKQKPLKYLAKKGLEWIIDNPLDTDNFKEEQKLSDFDKSILKAMKFNPNEK